MLVGERAPHANATHEGEPAVALYDRLGARAWAVAIWIVEDEEIASRILEVAFTHGKYERGRESDARLLYDVWCRASATASARSGIALLRPRRHGCLNSLPNALAALPQRQRAIVELVLLGKLDVATIAVTMGLPCPDVLALLADALRTLRPLAQPNVPDELVTTSFSERRPGKEQSGS